uniref:Aldehyde dehydrogenase 3 family, member B1 n=1 Tax=Neogobius melanostomus TaxID=47308 RepID=A0A8C6U6U1_9GOBI
MASHSEVLQRLRTSFRSGVTVPEEFRRAQLKQLLRMLEENEESFLKALHQDLAKPKFEATVSELVIVANEAHYALANLKSWLQPEYVSKNLATKVDTCYVRREPLGVALIIGPWNYPIHLLLLPLVGAIAAGNCVVIKPSEVTASVEAVIAELIPKYLSQKSPDLPRIVSPKHWSRLMGLLGRSKGTVVLGGESDEADKYIAPTVLVDVPEDDALMQEEIFGPILPILTVETLEEGINFINQRDKPLALYLFSDVASVANRVLEETSSGAFVSNDGIIYMTLPSLPFGGVGASGFGNYHGRWGFETFSHRRAVMLRGWALERLNAMRYPPYNDTNLSWLRWSASPRLCSIL